jgi:oligopeptide transport system ATP-binding protein
MSAALLEVEKLVTRYPAPGGSRGRWIEAVSGVSLKLERGEILGLVGESGSGKSTLARTIIGLLHASSGSVRLDGVELTGLSRRAWLPHRRRMQMVFQDPYASLDPRQTVASIVAEPLRIHRRARGRNLRARTVELLETVGLDESHSSRYPHELSGGQRQRIGIARALALEPEVLLCDEPVSALDVSIQAQITGLLLEIQARRELACLFIAHDLALVRHLCPRIAVMQAGRIVETGGREEIFARPGHAYTRQLLESIPRLDRIVGIR